MRVLLLLAAAGCSAGECEDKLDCPSGQFCTGDGVCMKNPPVPVPPRDGGPPPDAAPDAGFLPGDAGPDSGVDGGVDAGDLDSGMDSGIEPFEGELWIAEYTQEMVTAFTTFAQFTDRRGATYDVLMATAMPNNGTCTLLRERVALGIEVGIEAGGVAVDTNNLVNQTLVYVSMGDGRYAPQFPPAVGLFLQSISVDFRIQAGAGAGTLDDATASLPTPAAINVLPGLSSPIILSQGVSFSWTALAGAPGRETVAEIYDADREVVLTCTIDQDTGSFAIPTDVTSAFAAESPTSPVLVELRYQHSTIERVPVQGGGSVPVRFVAAAGRRWTTL